MFDFNEYIVLAEQLERKTDEASKRSAVSRAYYGVLMRARKYLKEKGKLPNLLGGDTHKKIWGTLAELGGRNSAEERIAKRAQRLKFKREQADYELTINMNIAAWAQQGLAEAKSIRTEFDKLTNKDESTS
jgi:hypothetical protein